MNIFGAKADELVGVANYVAREMNASETWVTKDHVSWYGEGNIAGIRIKLSYHWPNAHPSMFSLLGNGWMVSFQMKRRVPNLAPNTETAYVELVLPHPHSRRQREPVEEYYIFSPTVLSPDQFLRDMTLLRLFSSEWE